MNRFDLMAEVDVLRDLILQVSAYSFILVGHLHFAGDVLKRLRWAAMTSPFRRRSALPGNTGGVRLAAEIFVIIPVPRKAPLTTVEGRNHFFCIIAIQLRDIVYPQSDPDEWRFSL
jgi:hypothetical protein